MSKMKRYKVWNDARKLFLIKRIAVFHTHDGSLELTKKAIYMINTVASSDSRFINRLIDLGELDNYIERQRK